VAGAVIKGSLLQYVDNVLYTGCGSTICSPKLIADMEAASSPEDALRCFCDGWLSVFNCSKVGLF
jgi:hypothetical protein